MSKKCISCGTPPQPYYVNENNSLTQDHAAIFRDTQFAAGIYLAKEFVVPAIDTDIQIQTKNLINIVVGSYLWSPAYGYLKIVHWDECTGKLGLLNEDISGAAIPGTVVSEGSLWAVTARPCCADQNNFSLFPFLAEDYVIPAVSNSVTLAVTSTFGLIVGTTIRIGSNVYFLNQINSSLEIVVTNQGAGGVPGTIVAARDVNGDLQYLITQAVTSACTATGVDTVKLIGCDGINENILTGEYATQVPVLQSPVTSEVAFQLLDTGVRTCTFLTAAINILSATPSYTIDVDDESVFDIGDILQLDFGSLRWEITDNTTPGELDITCTAGNPGSSFNIPNGSAVCLQLITDNIQSELNTGWIPLADVGTYISASSFSLAGDITSYLKVGQKIKLLLNAVEFYANIASFSFGSGITTITIIVNLDYVLTNTTITFIEFSNENPQDFPGYFNYACNPGGFSADTSSAIYYVLDGVIYGKALISGTSDATTFTVDIPVASDLAATFGLVAIDGQGYSLQDNSANLTTVGRLLYTAYPTMNLYKDQALGAWTNSGGKAAVVVYNYPIAQ